MNALQRLRVASFAFCGKIMVFLVAAALVVFAFGGVAKADTVYVSNNSSNTVKVMLSFSSGGCSGSSNVSPGGTYSREFSNCRLSRVIISNMPSLGNFHDYSCTLQYSGYAIPPTGEAHYEKAPTSFSWSGLEAVLDVDALVEIVCQDQ